MKELINLSRKKLELLKNNGDARRILELDIAFNKAYKDFLIKNNLKHLDNIDQSKYMEQLRQLKSLVTEIYDIEIKKSTIKEKQRKSNMNKKITNLYKKNMK